MKMTEVIKKDDLVHIKEAFIVELEVNTVNT